MEREGENLTTGAGEPPSAADAYRASAALGGLLGWSDCRSGTKGQPPLVFPQHRSSSGGGHRRQQVDVALRARLQVCHVAHPRSVYPHIVRTRSARRWAIISLADRHPHGRKPIRGSAERRVSDAQ